MGALGEVPDAGRAVSAVSQVLKTGDVIYVEAIPGKDGQYRLHQIPEIEGAITVMEPRTGLAARHGGRLLL